MSKDEGVQGDSNRSRRIREYFRTRRAMPMKEATEYLGVSRMTIYRLIESGELSRIMPEGEIGSESNDGGRTPVWLNREDVSRYKSQRDAKLVHSTSVGRRSTRAERPGVSSSEEEIRCYAQADDNRWPLTESDIRELQVLELFSTHQAAKFLGVGVDVIYDLIDLDVLQPLFTPDGPRIFKRELLSMPWSEQVEKELLERRSGRVNMRIVEVDRQYNADKSEIQRVQVEHDKFASAGEEQGVMPG